MANQTFRVGEIAILQNCVRFPQNNGSECEIVSLPRAANWVNPITRRVVSAGNYVTHHHGEYWQTTPHQLRKRRPPQDWVKLCNLHDIPREVSHV